MDALASHLPTQLQSVVSILTSSSPRPGLHPIPGSKPLTLEAAILPPLLYYVALLFLPPPPPSTVDTVMVKSLRNTIASFAAYLFFRLPLAYHVPQSIGLTYQLGLVGLYGGCRVVDAFFISYYLFDQVPRRVQYRYHPRVETPESESEIEAEAEAEASLDSSDGLNSLSDNLTSTGTETTRKKKPKARMAKKARTREWTDGGVKDPYFQKRNTNVTSSSTGIPEEQKQEQNIINAPTTAPATISKDSTSTSSSSTSSASASINSSNPNLAQRKNNVIRRTSTFAEESLSLLSRSLTGPDPQPVLEDAHTEAGYPRSFTDRATWALELELAMRGTGFTWTTADVRHTRKTWLPTVRNRVHSILIHVLPIQLVSWIVIRWIYTTHLVSADTANEAHRVNTANEIGASTMANEKPELFDTRLSYPLQILLTASLGAFLMSAFSLGHSLSAILLSPLAPSPLAFFPPLYTTRVWAVTSVRRFWSYGWHRLFARLFLVWGVWPGEYVERQIMRKRPDEPADVGKVIGAFASSAFVHSFAARGVLAGVWSDALGETWFFGLNGLAVVVEDVVWRGVKMWRRRGGGGRKGGGETMWYDAWIGRVWWLAVLLWTGRNFARGWVKSGLVREMSFL